MLGLFKARNRTGTALDSELVMSVSDFIVFAR